MNTPHHTDRYEVRVNDREQLIYLLTEAAEIEHGLMCTYLYAAWSLKKAISENVSATQLQTIDRWRREIRNVAIEEMAHLTTVNNLLMSIGMPPHFRRQNFPVPAGYHPSSLVVRLAPLSRETLAHFVYLERPDGMDMTQAPGFESAPYQRRPPRSALTPTSEDYDTVGHLYRGIRRGFESLSERLGEAALFVGAAPTQVGPEVLDLPGITSVTDLSSAVAAIDVVIEQGEGGSAGGDQSHFVRFVAMAAEYDAFLQQDPHFVPHRAVVSDPLMFAPISGHTGRHISASDSEKVLDLANATYGLMLRLLASASSGADRPGVATRTRELDGAIGLMHVLQALGTLLTTLPVSAGSTQCAGMNFHLPRGGLGMARGDASRTLLAERAHELALALDHLARRMPPLQNGLTAALREVATALSL